MKGVRLDAEGGGAFLDDEMTAVVSDRLKAPQGAVSDGVADEGGNAGELGSQKGGSRKVCHSCHCETRYSSAYNTVDRAYGVAFFRVAFRRLLY